MRQIARNHAGYSPDVEANRRAYAELANALATMAALKNCPDETTPPLLDIEPHWITACGQEPTDLADGLRKHFQTLFGAMDWDDPNTIQKFYVELRLYADQLAFERRMEREFAHVPARLVA